MSTAFLCLILLAAGVIAVKSYRRRLISGCCGGSGGPAVKRVRVRDRDLSHYPFHKVLKVDGMSCGNCAAHVENALNSIDGVWAIVNLGDEEAEVRLKQDTDSQILKDAVKAAGYTVYRILEDNE